ncbi:MAG: family 10 glycosylhydrolase [Oscillospiraceae bacterium]|nr:family 10 glycosylhydrolase [Oscillospiraceae bacterium]
MKKKSLVMLSLMTAACLLGGCAEGAGKLSVDVVDVRGKSAEYNVSSTAGLGQAVGFPMPEIKPVTSSSSTSDITPTVVSPQTPQTPTVTPAVPVISTTTTTTTVPVVPEEPEPVEEDPELPDIPDVNVGTNYYTALNYSEVKGIWISFLELNGLASGSEGSFRQSISEVYDNCVDLGINTVYVHVRSHGDAYYDSELFPRTKYLGGSYDPLSIMIDEAHERGLSFQAWINPMRGCATGDIGRESGYPLYNWAGNETKLVTVNGYYYLNPAYDDVIELIAEGAAEIVANYDVDGIHIDDYFYPTTEKWFDNAAYQASPYTSLDDFRFANCDRLVSALYKAVKDANSTALFGVSPQGNYDNNYYYMYADVKKWCTNSGYLDYIMPQIYFGFDNANQPFETCLAKWDNIAKLGGTPLIVGLGPYRIGDEDSWAGSGRYEWQTDKKIIARQVETSEEAYSYGGICLYSYNSLFKPSSSVKSQVEAELAALKSALN